MRTPRLKTRMNVLPIRFALACYAMPESRVDQGRRWSVPLLPVHSSPRALRGIAPARLRSHSGAPRGSRGQSVLLSTQLEKNRVILPGQLRHNVLPLQCWCWPLAPSSLRRHHQRCSLHSSDRRWPQVEFVLKQACARAYALRTWAIRVNPPHAWKPRTLSLSHRPHRAGLVEILRCSGHHHHGPGST